MQFFCNNFPEYLRDIIIRILIIVYSFPQHFLRFKLQTVSPGVFHLCQNNLCFSWQKPSAYDEIGNQEQCTQLIWLRAAMIFISSLSKVWCTWKIHKNLTFESGSSQNRRFQKEMGGLELSSQNRSKIYTKHQNQK